MDRAGNGLARQPVGYWTLIWRICISYVDGSSSEPTIVHDCVVPPVSRLQLKLVQTDSNRKGVPIGLPAEKSGSMYARDRKQYWREHNRVESRGSSDLFSGALDRQSFGPKYPSLC